MLSSEITVGINRESYNLPLSTVSLPAAREDLKRANPKRDRQDGHLKGTTARTPEAVLPFILSLDSYYPDDCAALNRQAGTQNRIVYFHIVHFQLAFQ